MPRLATVDLAGRVVTGVTARGKHLLVRLDDGRSLHTHLGMGGTWQLYRPDRGWREPAREARVVLRTGAWTAVGFRLPVLELIKTADEGRVLGHLGPDVLGSDWNAEEAIRRLAASPDLEIGTALLDQRLLAGVGNAYRNEVLFLRGVWPWTPVRDVPRLDALVDLVKRLMEAHRDAARRVTTGDARRGRELWVQQRAGEPCRRCGTPVRLDRQRDPDGPSLDGVTLRRRMADRPGLARATYWCPSCQPAPRGGPPGEPAGGGQPPA